MSYVLYKGYPCTTYFIVKFYIDFNGHDVRRIPRFQADVHEFVHGN